MTKTILHVDKSVMLKKKERQKTYFLAFPAGF